MANENRLKNKGKKDSLGRLSFNCFFCHRKTGKNQAFCNEACKEKNLKEEEIQKENGTSVAEHWEHSEFVMADGSIKRACDIRCGDELLGSDSKVLKILDVKNLGIKECYKITPTKGESYKISEDSLIALRVSPRDIGKLPAYVTLSVKEYLNKSPKFKGRAQVYRSEGVEFGQVDELPIPPYILGLWLGDGSAGQAVLTSADKEVSDVWVEYGKSLGMDISIRENVNEFGKISPAKNYCFIIPEDYIHIRSEKDNYRNAFCKLLFNSNLFNNKNIPLIYKLSSVENRLQLLAGLIDTDGSLSSGYFDFVNKNINPTDYRNY